MGDGGDHFRNFGEMHGGGDGLSWMIFVLLLLLVLFVAVQLALSFSRRRHFGGPPGGGHGGPPWGRPDPLAIAQARYARGELDRDAYLQFVQDLAGGAAPPPPAA